METLIKQIKNINSLSKDILLELSKQNPSFEEIRGIMVQRQGFIDEFGIKLTKIELENLSDGKKEIIKSFFDEFLVINDNIKDAISEVLTQRKKRLSAAKKQRQAEDGYNVLVKPDISYFQRNQ